MRKVPGALVLLVGMAGLTLTGCGGGGSSSYSPPPSATYTVGGTVSGLSAGQSITLLNNGGDALAVSGNGTFLFSTGAASGSTYDVTVQSPGLSCSAGNGSGTVGSSNVTSIAVACTPIPFTVGGTVSGLDGSESVTLQNNGADATIVSGDGGFTFSTSQIMGSTYDVTVQSHTPGITCAVTSGSGTVGTSDVTGVALSCVVGTESILHSFSGSPTDGSNVDAGVTMDSAGNLYGTTEGGGANAEGSVFKISAAGVESTLYSFGASTTDGFAPMAGLILDSAGNLYGTTFSGGANGYYGTVFKVSPSGTETIVHSFGVVTSGDAATPQAGVIMDGAGNLYGTGYTGGGVNNDGAVYEISAAGTESVLYSFPYGANGNANPAASLIMDSSGNLFGTSIFGGANNQGTVFKITAAASQSTLHSFGATAGDGANPEAPLIMDGDGNLYGTTDEGGAHNAGTVFEIDAAGTESILYSFGSSAADGLNPLAGLIMDGAGNLYGTTYNGGANGDGTVFKISAGGTESVLYSFGSNATDGVNPRAGLIIDSVGNLYGTTQMGGVSNYGTVFEIN